MGAQMKVSGCKGEGKARVSGCTGEGEGAITQLRMCCYC